MSKHMTLLAILQHPLRDKT